MNMRLTLIFFVCLGLWPTVALADGGTIEGTLTGTAKVRKDAVVYIADAPKATSTATISYDQKGMVFMPRVLPVVRGTTVSFLNSDTVRHNVFSPDFEKYNLGTWPTGESKSYVFDKCAAEVCSYTQLCNVHPEMEGFIVVFQTDRFVQVSKDGSFKLEGVPAGNVTLKVWSPKKHKAAPMPVTVKAGESTSVTIAL